MTIQTRTAVIVTALPVERDAVMKHLHSHGEEEHRGSIYRLGIFDEDSAPWKVIVAEIGAGNVTAAAEAIRLFDQYHPAIAMFVGIAGGVKDLAHGDVVASTKIYGIESGKDLESHFSPRPAIQLPSYHLEQRARYETGEDAWRKRIKTSLDVRARLPVAKMGAIAASEKVVGSKQSALARLIQSNYSDVLAVEMEGLGFLLGARMSEQTQKIVIRSISDCLDDKTLDNDMNWQPIAAAHAAAFAFQILSRFTPPGDGAASLQSAMSNVTTNRIDLGNVIDNGRAIVNEQRIVIDRIIPGESGQSRLSDNGRAIDRVRDRLLAGKVDAAIDDLLELRRTMWDKLSAYEKYRVYANLGFAHERKAEFEQAAKYLIEAAQQQPEDRDAKALKARAECHLGSFETAFEQASDILKANPTCVLAAVALIHSAPLGESIANLRESFHKSLHSDIQVLHALISRAIYRGDYEQATDICNYAITLHPNTDDLQELQAVATILAVNRLCLSQRSAKMSNLVKAVETLNSEIAKTQTSFEVSQLRAMRAIAYHMLGKQEECENDFRIAIESAPRVTWISRYFAMWLLNQGRMNAAISILDKLKNINTDAATTLLFADVLQQSRDPNNITRSIALLESAWASGNEMDERLRFGCLELLISGYIEANKCEEGLAFLDSLQTRVLGSETLISFKAVLMKRKGDHELARQFAQKALRTVDANSAAYVKMQIAKALAIVDLNEEALTLCKQFIDMKSPTQFIEFSLKLGEQLHDEAYILATCEALRLADIILESACEMETNLRFKYGDFDGAVALLHQMLSSRLKNNRERDVRLQLSLVAIAAGKPELIETDLSRLPVLEATTPDRCRAQIHVLTYDADPMKAIRFAYDAVRHFCDDAAVNQAFIEVVGLDDRNVELFPPIERAEVGSAVMYVTDDSLEEQWIILEDSPQPRSDRNEYPASHAISQAVLGKAVGEEFLVRRDRIQQRTGTVKGIISKFLYLKEQIIDKWETRFPAVDFIRKYGCQQKHDGTLDLTIFFKAMDLREERRQQVNQIYRTTPISVAIFAKFNQISNLSSLLHLTSEGLPIRCALGDPDEIALANAAIERSDGIIIDGTALATLFASKQYESLRGLKQKLFVCRSSLREYEAHVLEMQSPRHGFSTKRDDRYLFCEDDPALRSQTVEQLKAFLEWMASSATVISGIELARLSVGDREQLIKIFGQPIAEAVAHAKNRGNLLWTDDLSVAVFAQQKLGLPRVWTQRVFQVQVAAHESQQMTLFLFENGYSVTHVSPEIVITAGNKCAWDVSQAPLLKLLKWLGGDDVSDETVVAIGGRMLPLVWVHAPLATQRDSFTASFGQCVCTRPNGRLVLTAIIEQTPLWFGLNVIGQQQCRKILQSM